MNVASTPKTRVERLDVLALIAAHLLALVSFRSAFSGGAFFIAGLVGVLASAAYWIAVLRSRLPGWVRWLGAIGVFALVGPPAIAQGDSGVGFLPSPAAIGATFSGAVHGWRTLVVTLPPVGDVGHVLVVPYLCGFLGVSVSMFLLRSTRSPVLAVVPPIAVLGLGVLVGTKQHESLFVEAGLLLAIVLLWASTLDQRARPVLGTVRRGRQLVTSIAVLAVVAFGAGVLGSHVPYTHDRSRYVLRDHIEPPFDPTQYPSPLAGFRKYRAAAQKQTKLLTVTGLKAGTSTRLRIAVMDDYDGLVWRVADNGGADAFRLTGSRLPEPTKGSVNLTITIQHLESYQSGDPQGVWLPLVGQPSRIEFKGSDAEKLQRGLRYNQAQGAAAEPGQLASGDQYTLQTVVSSDTIDTAVAQQPAAGDPEIFSSFADKAGALVKSASDPSSEAKAIADTFTHKGTYDDGPTVHTPPGHFLARISEFLRQPVPVGDAEQYAAAAAILLRGRQIPARVVLGLKDVTAAKHQYTYDDVSAWVEIPVAGHWVAYDVTPSNKPKQQPQPKQQDSAGPQPPPQPPRASLSASSGSVGSAESKTKGARPTPPAQHGGGNGLLLTVLGIACIPIVIFAAPILLILGLKRRRRNQRRRAPTPALQIAGGWDDVVDFLRDLGRPVPATATRRELASTTTSDGLAEFATRVDMSTFAAPEPSADDARLVWSQAAGIRRRLGDSIGRLDRVRCALSITSLRPGR